MMIADIMRILFRQLAISVIGALALTSGMAQSTGMEKASVDSALLAKAAAGDAVAQIQVGNSYVEGHGQTRSSKQLAADYAQAAEWYRKAAEQGDIDAQLHLASLYRDGRGVVRDMVQAATWYRKAAEQGDVGAQATLGVLYSMGLGVERNDVEAYFWLDLAASVKGPNQDKYAANRQMIGTHITADEVAEVQERVAQSLALRPRSKASE